MPKSVEEVLANKLQRKHGEGSAVLLSQGSWSRITDVCPTGLAVIDNYVLGCGGMPYGRVAEIFGLEGGGKTTLMNRLLASCQREGDISVLCDAENKYDEDWAKLHGVDPDRLVIEQPAHLEGWLEITENAILGKPTGKKMLVALDSVAGLKCRRAVEEGLSGDAAVAEEARVWSRSLPLLVRLAAQHKVAVVLLNQVRMKIGVMYGNPETTPGGNAIKAYAAIRLSVMRGKQTEDKQGTYMHVSAPKNQVRRPMHKAQLKLNFATGFDDRWNTLHHAKEVGCVDNKCRKVSEALKNLGWPGAEGPEEEIPEEAPIDPVVEAATEDLQDAT
jgi:recombination protein RecA